MVFPLVNLRSNWKLSAWFQLEGAGLATHYLDEVFEIHDIRDATVRPSK